MRTTFSLRCLWIAAALISAIAETGLCQVQPVGRKAGLIQFDTVTEMNEEEGTINRIWFTRHWVCQDFYAVSVVWEEPPVFCPITSLTILSDSIGVRMDDGLVHELIPVNTTYPKPLGERGPLRVWADFNAIPSYAKARFAEAEAASRRVYAGDLPLPLSSSSVIDVKATQGPDAIKRKLAQLKVRTSGNCIDSMELFGSHREQLGRVKYEYRRDGDTPRLTRIIADWPERPEKLAVDVDGTTSSGSEMIRVKKTVETECTSHKGGRTATVIYKDIALGDMLLRLPVQVEVRRTSDKRLLRSAKLTNFKRVEMDKAQVWEAAKSFGGRTSEDQTWEHLVRKYHPSSPTIPLEVDPNDVAFVEKMTAKYPVPPLTPAPLPDPNMPPRDRFQYLNDLMKQEERNKPRMKIAPPDAELIRKEKNRFSAMLAHLTPEERTIFYTQGWFDGLHTPSECERQVQELQLKLIRILDYHHTPSPPEEKHPPVEPNDVKLLRQLQGRYEKLAVQQDPGLGAQLRALETLIMVDGLAQDNGARDEHVARYLQTLQSGGFMLMYTMRGYSMIEMLMKAHQYDRANKLMRQWADFSVANNDADAIFRFGNRRGPGTALSWANVQLLDRLLKKSSLSAMERYEAMAMRAIALDAIDRLLTHPDANDVQAQWIRSATTQAATGQLVEPAVRQAISAWESLGPARENEAKPYSTVHTQAWQMNVLAAPSATRLQETSAQLDKIVQQRLGQRGTPSRSGQAGSRSAQPARSGTQR